MLRGARWMMVLGLVVGGTGDAVAQSPYGPGGALYVNFVVADAIGDFGYAVDQGYGMEIGAGIPIAADGHMRMRFDGGFSIYGLERVHYCDYGCRVGSTVTTANSVFYAGAGPEFVLGAGAIRPCIHESGQEHLLVPISMQTWFLLH